MHQNEDVAVLRCALRGEWGLGHLFRLLPFFLLLRVLLFFIFLELLFLEVLLQPVDVLGALLLDDVLCMLDSLRGACDRITLNNQDS